MRIALTPEQEVQLDELARHNGLSVDRLLTELAHGLLEESAQERETILDRIAQADKGIFIEEEEMDARVEAMLQRG